MIKYLGVVPLDTISADDALCLVSAGLCKVSALFPTKEVYE